MNLNNEQALAAKVSSSRSLILAGPGTGKTTTLVGRFDELLKRGVSPETILCCTFAKKAAEELKSRINDVSGLSEKNLTIGTFHSVASRAVKQLAPLLGIEPPNDVLNEPARRKIIADIQAENEGICKNLTFEQQRPSVMLKSIDEFRERLLLPEDASLEAYESGDAELAVHAEIYDHYDQYLTRHNKIDYARMIQFAVRAFALDASAGKEYVSRFNHILVDEFQDINFAQKRMLDELLKGGASLWVVGDDDQAIYGWRGSSLDYILNFDQYFENPEIVSLFQNYRSAPEIVDAANGLATHFLERREKRLKAVNKTSGEIHILKANDEGEEARKVASLLKNLNEKGFGFGDMAILARTNALPSGLVEQFLLEDIPVSLPNGVAVFNGIKAHELLTACAIATTQKIRRSYNRKLGPKVFSFAKRLEADDGWRRKVKALATFLTNNLPKSLSDEKVEKYAADIEACRDFLCRFEYAQDAFTRLNAVEKNSDKSVHVGTIHGAKGLEWDAVVILACEDDKFPHYLCETPSEVEEERRLFYVGITRAKRFLGLSWASERRNVEQSPSPFLSEIQSKSELSSGKVSDAEFSKILSQIQKWGEEYDYLRKQRLTKDRVAELSVPSSISTVVADGLGAGSGWNIRDTGNGFLLEVGYTAKIDGPNERERQGILLDVLYGRIDMPESIRESVAKKWGEPNSAERLKKIRNTINVAIGTQKGRSKPSLQAIEKWEADLRYIDNELEITE